MEEDREFKHVCKFCSKSFPCGRSLGGHMRSHMINNNSAEITDFGKLSKKKKLSSFVNNNIGSYGNSETPGYGLRENPKKTRRLADSNEESSIYDKFCKESSGKGHHSWKASVGNMNSTQSEKDTSFEDQDSWTIGNEKLVMDSQSDNETAAPNRKRRSKRRTRYMVTARSFSVSEIQQEQEEVAMCLMMLSRDVGPRGGLNSIAESSNNNSEYFEAKNEVKNSVCSVDEVVKLKMLKKKSTSGFVDSENFQFEGRHSEYSVDGFVEKDGTKKSQLHYLYGDENSEVELGRNSVKETESDHAQLGSSNKFNSNKKKLPDSSTTDVLETELHKHSQKRSKFECTTCNKIFHSYQALGGHRASHKKIKFASKINSSETSIETELSPDPTPDSKIINSMINETETDHSIADCDERADTSYGAIKKRHECPICLKVFSSGQALGGHKRSHLINANEARNNPTIVIEKPIPEIRSILDLNLPAPVEEDSSNAHLGSKPWWIASSHKHEALVGLISN
ncbi:zinc finger protein ZAT4-like [Mangifera indica]|uniref:zinc finger protein ZAT4-like n=1 Tax=Mangifera indica TaxID=29780 RepID=UPI001CFBF963|nr:zinc finger protein ZAT4-like [Mangifera indica]